MRYNKVYYAVMSALQEPFFYQFDSEAQEEGIE
jgi:hypothetical protein